MELTYVFYTHTSYSDVMNIQLDYIKGIDNKILVINNNDNHYLLNNFKRTIFYDDNQPYSQRLLKLISEINDEYILLMHDNDILVEKDDSLVLKCLDMMISNVYDRIDFQVGGPGFTGHEELIQIDDDGKFYLSRNNNPNCYIYNVNPSIWRVSSLKKILENFPNESYHDIEHPGVQSFCVSNNFKIFKLMGKETLMSSPFTILPFFQFIHITHQGNFLPITNNNLSENLKNHYANIITKHNLLEGSRKFDTHLTWGW